MRDEIGIGLWLGLGLVLLAAVGCTSQPELVVLSGDRTVIEVPCAHHPSLLTPHCFEVSEVWMQERYQLERALRLRLERCEADGAGREARGERPEAP